MRAAPPTTGTVAVVSAPESTDSAAPETPRRVEGLFAGWAHSLPADHPHQQLLTAVKARLPELSATLEAVSDDWVGEDLVYRFWHQSFKVYALQDATSRIVDLLRSIGTSTSLHPWFEAIVASGTGVSFDMSHNSNWTQHTRPILEAFFHARFMLEMAVRYGSELDAAPALLPSGWAALLHLYEIR